MKNLSKYIEKIEKYLKANPDLSEDLLIRYVYMDLGLRFSFNPQFLPFGNSKKRQEIYYKSNFLSELDKCMKDNLVICKSGAKIFEYILKHFGVNIETVVEDYDNRKCPHVYNVIKPKNGDEPYRVDLQEDMYRIQMHGFTTNYGLSLKDENTYVIPRFKQEQMDRKLGFIDNNHYYTDEYLYLLKSDICYFDDFRETAKFILENIEVFENPQMKYTDRQWYHVQILQQFFDRNEFDYENNNGKIHIINCYKKINDETKDINCISVEASNETDLYVYNKKEGKYSQISLSALARAVKNGLILHNCRVKGLGKILKQLKQDNGR